MMRTTHFQHAVATCAVLAVLAGGMPDAQARPLFERLFGGPPRAEQNAVEERSRALRGSSAAPSRPAPKISAPSYYNYQPEGLVAVDFAEIEPAAREGGASTASDKTTVFQESLPLLADFQLFAEKDIAKALIAHYSDRPDFIWLSDGRVNDRAKQVLRVLGEANQYGLSESDYLVSLPAMDKETRETAGRQEQLIRFEMALSARALRYARDAYRGRVDPNKLSGYHDLPLKPMNMRQTLGFMTHASDVATYLERLHPQNDEYRALRVELEMLRAAPERDIVVDPGTFVRPGGSDPEFTKILALIERDADASFDSEHGIVLATYAGSETYAHELVPVIKAAQEAHGLNPDGVIGPRTVQAIAGVSRNARIEKVLFALERLRWLPSKLGDSRVMINVAGFKVDYFEEGKPKLSMRTVVGKASNQTSFFYDQLEYVEFNPYWGVPRSILVNEMLPKLRRDPSYLDRNGYEVTNSRGQRVSSAAVNWSQYGAKVPYYVRQTPGRSNALGELKIMFPNKHSIYMHDTPAKSLFQRDTRAFSHGCVRLEDPRAMAAAVLDVSVEDVAGSIARGSGKPSRQEIERKIPIYVGYFTAWPQASGDVVYHGDVYGRDERLKTALEKTANMRVASG